jgi:hypothetical protein
MKRRLFLKKTSILSSGILFFPSKTISAAPEQASNTLDLVPVFNNGKNVLIKGSIVDFKTQLPVSTEMTVTVQRNRFYSQKHTINAINGSYAITTGFASDNKISEKVKVLINAEGYKSYESYLYLTHKGCNIHSEHWNYNPEFRPEFSPVNQNLANGTISEFNFYLVKN